MPKCIPSPLVGAISGKLNATVFRASRSGQLVVRRGRRVERPLTWWQQMQRTNFAKASAEWAGMGEDTRRKWQTWGQDMTFPDRFGVARHLTGRQLFLKFTGQMYRWSDYWWGDAQPRVSLAPTGLSAEFFEGGPYNVTTSGTKDVGSTSDVGSYALVTRSWQRAPRVWFRTMYAYPYAVGTNDVKMWFAARGVAFTAGQVVRVRVYWCNRYFFGSPYLETEVTVQAAP